MKGKGEVQAAGQDNSLATLFCICLDSKENWTWPFFIWLGVFLFHVGCHGLKKGHMDLRYLSHMVQKSSLNVLYLELINSHPSFLLILAALITTIIFYITVEPSLHYTRKVSSGCATAAM